MSSGSLPEGIITRFRSLSLERIGRVEAVWNALLQGIHEEPAIRDLLRDLHTLKGDAHMVGFGEVHVLAQKLEELMSLAGQLHYEVSEDFDLVVAMAIQFVGMLLRKKSSSSMGGIDLEGFVRQVDEVLRETRVLRRSRPTSRRMTIGPNESPEASADRLSDATRHRLAIIATNAFLEYLAARGAISRHRLRGVWQGLRDELTRLGSTALAPLLERHVAAARQLADELGKRVELGVELAGTRTEARVAEAVDLAVVHLIRNAIDHGIEDPAARTAAGKPEVGRVAVRARDQGATLEIDVEDDGAGVDLAAVRARGIERELISAGAAASASDAALMELMFEPGFSTRAEVSPVSGRGVGLDAVKAALVRVGGTVRVSSRPGGGTVITLAVPFAARQVRAYQFLAPRGAVTLAISARWTPSIEGTPGDDAIDPMRAIQLMGGSRQTIVGMPRSVRDLALRLRWGFLEMKLRASTEPVLVTADRICATPDDYPLEVVLVDGQETLLLRPEHVAELVSRPPA